MNDQYAVGTVCWVSTQRDVRSSVHGGGSSSNNTSEQAWVSAVVVERQIKGDRAVLVLEEEDSGHRTSVECTQQELSNENSTILPPKRNPAVLESTDDLSALSYINEPSVLHNIKSRYQNLQIYTFSGIVLIAVNPFQAVNLYSNDVVQAYAGKARGELNPHLFAIAEDAYRCMLRDSANQTIVVSGESGAGKTVSAKYIMRYLATVQDPLKEQVPKTAAAAAATDLRNMSLVNGSNVRAGISRIEEQILATNPIMEAFGNAKTTRNDNSSRFGKYIEIMFNSGTNIVGAKMRTYLLERSRLVFQPKKERNYHIFYQLVKGATQDERAHLGLPVIKSMSDPTDAFHYLSQGGEPVISRVDDPEEFFMTRKALQIVGINMDTQNAICEILAALLHIGNIKIKGFRNEASCSASDDPALQHAVRLLGLDAAQFAKWIVKRQIATRSEKITSSLNETQATVVRDSVAKYIYACLFEWLVSTINISLATDEAMQQCKSFIGVLDIYGFEHFQVNSFEQFCINYANEKLQQEFNQHIFKLEQEEYMREKIDWQFIDFADNQPCIDLIEGKLGVLSLLDEESRLPSGTDATWITKINQQLAIPKHEQFFKKSRFGNTSFTVCHYALDVTYESEGFLEKNRDTVPDEQMEVLINTSNELLKQMLVQAAAIRNSQAPPSSLSKRAGAAAKKPTLGSIFKASLNNLMDTINSTNVHYIRCIKPNEDKAAWQFDSRMVLAQLRACGVLETIRISCAGFPTRWTFAEFASRYYLLVNSCQWNLDEIRAFSLDILKRTLPDQGKYQVGLTKIFFRPGMLAYLETLRSDRLNVCAILVQKNMLSNLYRKKYLRLRKGMIMTQTHIRGFFARKLVENMRRNHAAVTIQRYIRGVIARTSYLKARKQVIQLQALSRGIIARREYKNALTTLAAVRIQTLWRAIIQQNRYQEYRRKVVLIQCRVRQRLARRALNQLRVEAKSMVRMKEVSYRLENKVVELTQNLAAKTTLSKSLQKKITALEGLLQQWQSKHEALESRNISLQQETIKGNEAFEQLCQLTKEKAEMMEQRDRDKSNLDKMLKDLQNTNALLVQRSSDLEQALDLSSQQKATNNNLLSEITSLKDEVQKLSQITTPKRGAQISPRSAANGFLATMEDKSAKQSKRRSFIGGFMKENYNAQDDIKSITKPFKAQSGPMNGTPLGIKMWSLPTVSEGRPTPVYSDNPEDDIFELLREHHNELSEEVSVNLIRKLEIPQPSLSYPAEERDILFPSRLINLITGQMWKFQYIALSERFLASVMQAIQQHVMSFTGEDAIDPGAFWIANVHEMLSMVNYAERENRERHTADMEEDHYREYEHLVSLVKHDLENLEFNIFQIWMREIKKCVQKMIVPAILESQTLPGFTSKAGGGFLQKIMNNTGSVEVDAEDLIGLINKTYKAAAAFYVDPFIISQAITVILRLVNVTAFNDLLLRKNFLSWKRGLQITYNITRVQEWCDSHQIPEANLQLEHLQQAAKLTQLKKDTKADIGYVYDICWALNPVQLQRLISQYSAADYEKPIPMDILQDVAKKVISNTGEENLLLSTTQLDSVEEFTIPEVRMPATEAHLPQLFGQKVPLLMQLSELVTAEVRSRNGTSPVISNANGTYDTPRQNVVSPGL